MATDKDTHSAVVSYTPTKRRWRVYRDNGPRLEYIDVTEAFDVTEAARKVVAKHHDWRSDGMEWGVVVIAEDEFTPVTVTFEPKAVAR